MQLLAEGDSGVLAAVIMMMNESGGRLAALNGQAQGIDDQLGPPMIGHRPADGFPTKPIEGHR